MTLKKNLRPYTLIEMLVVMTIAAILISVSIPAFNHIINGNKLTNAGSQLKGLLEQAQSIAATRNRSVAVVLPVQRTSAWSGDFSDMVYRSGRLAYVKLNNAGTYDFDSWVEDSPWVYLPEGAMLVCVGNATGNATLPDGTTGLAAAIGNTNTAFGNLSVLKGVKDDKIKKDAVIPDCRSGIVFTRYGSVAGSSLRLFLAEAKDGGSAVIYPKRDNLNKPVDFVVLEVNQFTGRARYL